MPSGDSCCDEFRGHLQNAKSRPLSPLRFVECDLTAAVDRPNSWSSSRTRKTSYYSTNNVALIVPKCMDTIYWVRIACDRSTFFFELIYGMTRTPTNCTPRERAKVGVNFPSGPWLFSKFWSCILGGESDAPETPMERCRGTAGEALRALLLHSPAGDSSLPPVRPAGVPPDDLQPAKSFRCRDTAQDTT